MTQAKLISGLVGVGLFVATLSTTIHQLNRVRNADTALMAARETNSALSTEKKTLEEHLALAQHETDRLVKQRRDAESESSAGNVAHRAAGTAKSATWDPVAEGKAFMERHPAVRQAFINYENAKTNYRWSAFYEAAGLSQSEIADFQALMRQFGRFGLSRVQGMQDLDFRLGRGDTLTPEEWNGQFRALFGEERFGQFNKFSRSFSAREIAAQAAGALAFTPTPLDAEQFTGLVQRVTDSKAIRHTKGGPKIDWDIVTADAREVLTPAQLTALDGMRAQSEFNEEYSRVAAASNN
jgi:hypothetical protein